LLLDQKQMMIVLHDSHLIGDEDTLQINPYLNKNSPDYFFKKLSPEEIDKRIDYYFKLSIDDWQKSSFFKTRKFKTRYP